MKMMRVHITLWLVLLTGGFLLGYVPEYLKNRDLQAQLQDPQKTIDALKLQLQMSELRDAASMMLLELSRQNFGLARDYSGQFYSKLKDVTDAVQDPALKKSLEDLAATRENLTSQLATANAGALAASQPIVLKTFEVTRSVK
jgi:hypothetical protein